MNKELKREICDKFKRKSIRILGSQKDNPDEKATVKDIITEEFPELESTYTHT